MDIVIEFWSRERPGVEGYGVDFIIFSYNGKNSSESVIGDIGFHNELCVRNPMHKDRSKDEGLFQGVECFSIFVVKVPRSVFSSKTSKWNDYV